MINDVELTETRASNNIKYKRSDTLGKKTYLKDMKQRLMTFFPTQHVEIDLDHDFLSETQELQ